MSYSPSPFVKFTPTLADVISTAVATTFLSFVVPANTWRDGEPIFVRVGALVKNDTGARRTTSFQAGATGGSDVTVYSNGWDANASELVRVGGFTFMRAGSHIFAAHNGFGGFVGEDDVTSGNQAMWAQPGGLGSDYTYSSDTAKKITPTSFSSDITIELKATLATSSASYYIKPQGAMVFKSANTRGW